jgi:MFS transporter, CP family, cyanate transporter
VERVHAFGAAAALLLGPVCIAALGWRGWWWLLAGLSMAMALLLLQVLPAAAPPPVARQTSAAAWWLRLRRTLAVPGPWWVALSFCVYAGQWLSVIGFLPTIYAHAGVGAAAAGALSALAAAVNIAGNLLAGRLMHGGVAPTRLLRIGFGTMAVAALAAFGTLDGGTLPAALRYAAVLLFSAIGGMVPATLFALALRVAPSDDTLSTTVGWVQQWSSLGQCALPPLVAWVAGHAGGWQWTWLVTGACALVGIVLSGRIARLLHR